MHQAQRAVSVAAILALISVSVIHADEVSFVLENNAWDGNANLGVYPPSSGALIDYEMYISVEDTDGFGYASQGLAGFAIDILTNTGVVQPLLGFSPTSEESYATIESDLWSGGKAPIAIGGFGISSNFSHGIQSGDDVFGAGALMALVWDADTSSAPGDTPRALAGVGIGSPDEHLFDSGGNTFPYYGTARSNWYLLRGQTVVPDAPGLYTVDLSVQSAILISPDVDLNSDVTDGYVIPSPTPLAQGFSFQVTPEPATISLLLLAGAAAVRRRQR